MTLELGQTMSNLYMREKDVWGEEGIIWREVKGVEKHKNIVLGLWSCDCSSIAQMWNTGAEGRWDIVWKGTVRAKFRNLTLVLKIFFVLKEERRTNVCFRAFWQLIKGRFGNTRVCKMSLSVSSATYQWSG